MWLGRSAGLAFAIFCVVCPAADARCPHDCKREIRTGFKNCERVCPKGKAGGTCRKTCKALKGAAAAACVNANERRDASPSPSFPYCGSTQPPFCAKVGEACSGLRPCCGFAFPVDMGADCVNGRCVPPPTTTEPTTTTIPSTTTTTTLGGATCANGQLACGASCGGSCGGTCIGAATGSCSSSHCGSDQQVCVKFATPEGTCTTGDASCAPNSACIGNATAPCGTAFCWPVCPE